MFSPFFLYLKPVAPFFSLHIVSFAIGLRPLPLLSTLHPLSHFKCYIHSLLSSLITSSPLHTMPCALSLARLSLSTFTFTFPPLSLCSVHYIAVDSDSYKYPTCGLAKRQANWPIFPLLLGMFPGNRGPFYLVFAFVHISSSLV